jgi:hypothetical protein
LQRCIIALQHRKIVLQRCTIALPHVTGALPHGTIALPRGAVAVARTPRVESSASAFGGYLTVPIYSINKSSLKIVVTSQRAPRNAHLATRNRFSSVPYIENILIGLLPFETRVVKELSDQKFRTSVIIL